METNWRNARGEHRLRKPIRNVNHDARIKPTGEGFDWQIWKQTGPHRWIPVGEVEKAANLPIAMAQCENALLRIRRPKGAEKSEQDAD
jgi:hypothetical protein